MADSNPSLARTIGAVAWTVLTTLAIALLLAFAVLELHDRLTFSCDGEDCSNIWPTRSRHLTMACAALGLGSLSAHSLLLRRTWWPAIPITLALATAAVFAYQAFAFRG